MAITTCIPDSAKLAFLKGEHDATDTYRIALYTGAASLGAATAAYTTAGEASGSGYAAGGQVLTGYTAALNAGVASLDWADAVWPAASLTARGALIYNASKANAAVAVFDFGQDVTSTNADFTVQIPGSGAGVVRL